MKKPTFKSLADRLDCIETEGDVQAQMQLAKAEQTKLRSARRKACKDAGSFEESTAIGRAYDQAILASQKVLTDLRRYVFDIEDALKAGLSASTILSK